MPQRPEPQRQPARPVRGEKGKDEIMRADIKIKIWKRIAGTVLLFAVVFSAAACSSGNGSSDSGQNTGYVRLTAEEAKQMMDEEEDYVILDVRTEKEFDEEHIPGAVLIPDYEIENRAEEVLTDKAQLIFVYCRSGNRSKKASDALAKLGYTNVKEFGGIIDWPYETTDQGVSS